MALYTYTGTLTDIGAGLLAGYAPRLTVAPERETMGPDGLVSAKKILVPVNAATGAFSMTLHASGDLDPAIDYELRLELFEDGDTGHPYVAFDAWRFTAAVGGGPIADMVGGPLTAVWIGPPWPSLPSPPGLYIDSTPPNAWGLKGQN